MALFMPELDGWCGGAKQSCQRSSSSISTILDQTSPPTLSTSPKVNTCFNYLSVHHLMILITSRKKPINFNSLLVTGSSQIIAQYYQFLRLGFEVTLTQLHSKNFIFQTVTRSIYNSISWCAGVQERHEKLHGER